MFFKKGRNGMFLPILAILSVMPTMALHKPGTLAALIVPASRGAHAFEACGESWPEYSLYPQMLPSSVQPPRNDPRKDLTIDDPNRYRSVVDVSFQPGELHKTVTVFVPAPEGMRLFVRDASLKPSLPKEQHASVVIGHPLRFDGRQAALVGLYADHEHPITAQVTRDSSEGAGEITLTIEGGYFTAIMRQHIPDDFNDEQSR